MKSESGFSFAMASQPFSSFFPARYPVLALPEPEYKFLFTVPLIP